MVQNGIQRAGGPRLRHYMQAHPSCSFRALRERCPLRHLIMQVEFRREPNLWSSPGRQHGPNRRAPAIGNRAHQVTATPFCARLLPQASRRSEEAAANWNLRQQPQPPSVSTVWQHQVQAWNYAGVSPYLPRRGLASRVTRGCRSMAFLVGASVSPSSNRNWRPSLPPPCFCNESTSTSFSFAIIGRPSFLPGEYDAIMVI